MIEKKIFEIEIASDGTLVSVPSISLNQYGNNAIFRIKTDALNNTDGGTIALNFTKATGEDYPRQYATYSSDGVYDWRLVQGLTLEAPDSVNTIQLNIMAKDYNDTVFSTIPIAINLTQTNGNAPVKEDDNSTDSLSYDLNEVSKKVLNNKTDITSNKEEFDAFVELNKTNLGNKLEKDFTKYNSTKVAALNDIFIISNAAGNLRISASDLFEQVSSGNVSLFLGTYLSLEQLRLAHPEGEGADYKQGSYAYVDEVGEDILIALWDFTEKKWVLSGSGAYVSEIDFAAYKKIIQEDIERIDEELDAHDTELSSLNDSIVKNTNDISEIKIDFNTFEDKVIENTDNIDMITMLADEINQDVEKINSKIDTIEELDYLVQNKLDVFNNYRIRKSNNTYTFLLSSLVDTIPIGLYQINDFLSTQDILPPNRYFSSAFINVLSGEILGGVCLYQNRLNVTITKSGFGMAMMTWISEGVKNVE